MSTPIKIVSQFAHLIENGQSLSSAKIGEKTLEMMQMLAKNPSLVPTWQALKETLQALYNSLDDEQVVLSEPLEGQVTKALTQLISRN